MPASAVRAPAPPRPAGPPRPPARGASGAAYALFLLVHATLFLRPSELLEDVRGWNIFLVLSLLCLAVAVPDVLRQLSSRALEQRPMTVCVLTLLVAVGLSHLAHFRLEEALDKSVAFAKVVVYYLLLVSVVDSPRRVRSFLLWTLALTTVVAGLAALDFNQVLALPKVRVRNIWGDLNIPVGRMEGTGLFQDPNELCAQFAVGTLLCFYALGDRRAGPARLLWVGPLGLLLYGVVCTQSRGGLLALMVGLGAACRVKLGWSRTVLLGAVALPTVLLLVGGRQAELSAAADTGQERIQLWSDALVHFRSAPAFGIGMDEFAKSGVGLVAHNSYLQAFAELGLFGGLFFLGAVYFPLAAMSRLRPEKYAVTDPDLRGLYPWLFGALVAYATAMMTLSVLYFMPPYAILGVGTAFLAVASSRPPAPPEKFDLLLTGKLLAASAAFLLAMQLFVRVFRG